MVTNSQINETLLQAKQYKDVGTSYLLHKAAAHPNKCIQKKKNREKCERPRDLFLEELTGRVSFSKNVSCPFDGTDPMVVAINHSTVH